MFSPQEFLSWLYVRLQDRRNNINADDRSGTSANAKILRGFYDEARTKLKDLDPSSCENLFIDQVLDTISSAETNSAMEAEQSETDDGDDIVEVLSQYILNAMDRANALEESGGGKHSILVIDRLSPNADVLCNILKRTQEVVAKDRSYDIIYFKLEPINGTEFHEFERKLYEKIDDHRDDEELSNLERLMRRLRLAPPKNPEAVSSNQSWEQLCDDYNRYRHLRAVVIGPHLIGVKSGETYRNEWKNVIRTVRDIYPNMPIFLIAHEKLCGPGNNNQSEGKNDLQKNVTNFVQRNELGGVPIIFEANEIGGIESETLIKKLDKIVANYFYAPFWDALKDFTDSPIVSFHALPIGHRRSHSSSIKDFVDFYGVDSFSAETSLAAGPLDSLQSPSGPLKLAHDKAAIAFGARTGGRPTKVIKWENHVQGTRFVTNGTTTANKIVLGGHVRPGEYVLIDRNCHISHHYALAHCHAHPVYLQPFHNVYGISGPIPLNTIKERFCELFATTNKLPAAIVLTNPTFDGIFYNPRKVVESVREILWDICLDPDDKTILKNHINDYHPNKHDLEVGNLESNKEIIQRAFECIIFLFDEAWTAYAFFHPMMINHTAMKTAVDFMRDEAWANYGRDAEKSNEPKNKEDPKSANDVEISEHLRVYSTQSTHKSLSALRQGSMIHYRDRMMKHCGVREAFDQSYRSNTTTSPSASILASLDVARRQMQLDGASLVERAIRLSKSFRAAIGQTTDLGRDPNEKFYVIDKKGMLKKNKKETKILSAEDGYFLDPTRVTIGCTDHVKGSDIKKMLLARDIQINKYNNRSVLSIFNIGISISAKNTFIRALHSIEKDIEHQLEHQDDEPKKIEHELPLVRFSGLLCTSGDKDLGYWLKNVGRFKVEQVPLYDFETTGSKTTPAKIKALKTMVENEKVISANFVVPYPPGFPVLVPGQPITSADWKFLHDLKIDEIHGTERKDTKNKDNVIHLSVYILEIEKTNSSRLAARGKQSRKLAKK